MPKQRDNPVRRAASQRIGTITGGLADLAHELKNDIISKVNHFGVQQEQQLAAIHHNLTEQYGIVSSRISDLELRSLHGLERIEALAGQTDLANRRLMDLIDAVDRRRLADIESTGLDDIDPETALFLNHIASANGPLRESGLFMNGPLTVLWHPQEARLEQVNERIVEVPFVMRALADLEPGSRVLDVGGGESTVGLSLASIGYQVDLVEPGGFPVEHSNLCVREVPVEELDDVTAPDAIVLLSTIEHIGVGAYRQDTVEDADLAVMSHLWKLAHSTTRLVLTTPFGDAAMDDLQRTYDLDRLERLLTGWTVQRSNLAIESSSTEWYERDGLDRAGATGRTVALITAVRADDPKASPW